MKTCRKILTGFLCALLMLGPAGIPAAAEENDVPDSYRLEEVVVLSRHNIRAPLSGNGSALESATPHTWNAWSSNPSELSLRGGALETEMGQYFRKWLEAEEFIPENWHPEGEEARFYANAKQRTIATSRYFSAGFLPSCNAEIETRADFGTMDPVFHAQLTFANEEYRQDAEEEMNRMIPDLSEEYELLSDVVDFKDSAGYQSGELSDLINGDTEFRLEAYEEPTMTGSLKLASSLSDALILQYYEAPDNKTAGFGQELTTEQWQAIAHIKDVYQDALFAAPLVSANIANPLLKEIRSELDNDARKFSFLCGHDSNIGSVLSALDAEEYELPNAVETKTPIGGKLVFEKWSDEAGEEYARVRYVYQSSDQLRQMPLLTAENPPMSYVLSFEGMKANADGLYKLSDLEARFDEAIGQYDALRQKYGIEKTGVPDTGVR